MKNETMREIYEHFCQDKQLAINGNNFDTGFVSYLWDVTDTTNQAVYMGYAEASNITLFGDGGGNRDVTYMQIYRLGDT